MAECGARLAIADKNLAARVVGNCEAPHERAVHLLDGDDASTGQNIGQKKSRFGGSGSEVNREASSGKALQPSADPARLDEAQFMPR